MANKTFLLCLCLFFAGSIMFSACLAPASLGSSGRSLNRSEAEEEDPLSQEFISEQGTSTWNSDSFPLHVNIDSDIDEEKTNAITSALQEWNDLVGMEIFVWEEVNLEEFIFYGQICQPEPNTVFVFESELGIDVEGRILLGLATNYFHDSSNSDIKSSMVQFDDDLIAGNLYYVALHEFGHVLGLRHDENAISSIMFPHVLVSFGYFENADIAYVRNQF